MLAQGTTAQQPAKPKPQVAYGAPSGPYAGPIFHPPVQSFASPHPMMQMRGPNPGAMAVPYGYDPLSQSGQNIQAPPPGFVGHGGQSGADLLALQMRANLPGFKRSFGYGTKDEVQGDVGNLMALVPGPPFKGGQAVPDVMQIIKGYIGQQKSITAAERIKRATSAPMTNPELLPQMGKHAALAEAIIANRAFDRILAEQQRARDLQKAPSLGDILRERAG